MILILSFSVRFSLSNEQLLMLFHLLPAQNTKLCDIIYRFIEYLRNIKTITFAINAVKIASKFACCECGNDTSVFEKRSCYIELSIIKFYMFLNL